MLLRQTSATGDILVSFRKTSRLARLTRPALMLGATPASELESGTMIPPPSERLVLPKRRIKTRKAPIGRPKNDR
jgi:hypothetical protein